MAILLRFVVPLVSLAPAACTGSSLIGSRLVASPLPGTDGAMHAVQPSQARLMVLFFFANHCPCQAAHDARLRDLYALYHARGVDFLAVDSEIGASAPRDAAEAAARAYPFPILIDQGGSLARRLGAEYATEAFVIDRAGAVQYHGGIDSDKLHLHADATPFLREALDDLIADRPPRRAEGKALGCALETW
jgi:peroxiredoxin